MAGGDEVLDVIGTLSLFAFHPAGDDGGYRCVDEHGKIQNFAHGGMRKEEKTINDDNGPALRDRGGERWPVERLQPFMIRVAVRERK